MPSLKEIRNRITSVKKTQKTTSAMKMVSAAKLNRAEDTIRRARPYATKLRVVVSSLSSQLTPDDNPLFRDQEGKRAAVVLMTSDRGLCGGFNANLCKPVQADGCERRKRLLGKLHVLVDGEVAVIIGDRQLLALKDRHKYKGHVFPCLGSILPY